MSRNRVLGVLASWAIAVAASAAQGPAPEVVVHAEESLSSRVVVFDRGNIRCLRTGPAGQGKQSCQFLSDRDRVYAPYAQWMLTALYLDPRPRRVLVVGLGGASLPRALATLVPGVHIDAVDADPSMARIAAKYFDFKPTATTHLFVEDGRVFVRRAIAQGTTYDAVFLDAFDHQSVPEHLATLEFYRQLQKVLNPGGMLVMNTLDSPRLYEHQAATLYKVFGAHYVLGDDANATHLANRVLVLPKKGLAAGQDIGANKEQLRAAFGKLGLDVDELSGLLSVDENPRTGTRLLTDQYAPVNLLNSIFP